jgi:hypothetical protein
MHQLSSEPSEAAFFYNMPFLKTSISHIGLRTPPPSPEDAKPNHHHPRFPLPKFLRRTQPTQSPNLLAQNVSSNDGPLSPTFPRTHNAPSYPTSSPFWAVQHMKEPFPLVLPASPEPSDHSASGRSPRERLWKDLLSDQNRRASQPEQQPPFKASKPVALLPSPVFSELQIDQIPGSYFTSPTSSHEQSSPDGSGQASSLYEEHGILSSYYDSSEPQTCSRTIENANEASPTRIAPAVKQRHDARRDVGIVCAPSSFPQYQRCPRRDRPRSYSSEANWLAGNMSEKVMLEEWLSDLPRSTVPLNNQEDDRDDQHQIVSIKALEHPCIVLMTMQMHATRLKGAGRPKVVNISHPISLSTTSTATPQGLPSADRPNTPARPCQEISVFSPDTPVKHGRKALRWSATSLRPAPLTPQRSHQEKDSAPQVSSPVYDHSIRDCPELWLTESQDTFPIEVPPYSTRSPMRTPPPVLSTKIEAGVWSRCRELESILEAASQAVDTFPDGMLRLDSDAILALRNPHSQDDILINALQQIFPQTASLLLSALAALLLLDSYFSNLKEMNTSFNNTPCRHPNRKHGKLVARSTGCLQDIPIKARATLGIHLPNATVLQDHERALRKRAEIVDVCVGVQGQKILRAICGRFDEVVWRALKVVVTTLESTSSGHLS